MTQPEVPSIDWRFQLSGLEAYLDEYGGIIHVEAPANSPASIFSKVVRHLMSNDRWELPWRHVLLDARNASTHYLDDIVAQIAHSLDLDLDDAAFNGGGVRVANNIRAERVEIRDVNISFAEDEYSRSTRSMARIGRLIEAIAERLTTERIALILLNAHAYDKMTLSRFREKLWDRGLAELTSDGLLLINISDSNVGCGNDWPPPASLVLDLPERYDPMSELDAAEDLEKLALDDQLAANAGEAKLFAKLLISNSDRKVRDVYANLARARTSLKSPS